MSRLISLLAALSLGTAALAQTTTLSPNGQQVQLLAPQLLAFAGSVENFDSLVVGLTQGLPVTLRTPGVDGSVQVVTFAPAGTLTNLDTARVLEAARQSLIARGIANPTAQQLAVALLGGALPTALGSTQVAGILSGNTGTTPIELRTERAAPPGARNLSPAHLTALRTALQQGTATRLAGAGGTVTFTVPGGPMSALEADQAVALASSLLAQQGILDPTPEQLHVALLGGSLGSVAVQGVLEGRTRNTSDSRFFGTSDSRILGTSNTAGASNAVSGASPTAASGATGGAGARGVVAPVNRIAPRAGASR